MRSLLIIRSEPFVDVNLKFLQGAVQLLSEEQAVALILHGFVEPLTDTIRLRVTGFGPGVVDVLNRQVELIGMVLELAPILRSSVGQDTV